MFTDACSLSWDLACQVGGGSRDEKGRLHGMGCLITSAHVITAYHVLTGIQRRYEWPVVLKHDGLFRCETILSSEEYDNAILEVTEKIDDADQDAPAQYPVISAQKPSLGLSVGYIAALHIPKANGDYIRRTYFSSAYVSMFSPAGDPKKGRYALSNGIIQQGFSGGPVFTQNGELVGLIVESVRFGVDMEHPEISIQTLPVMAALYQFKDQIERLQAEHN